MSVCVCVCVHKFLNDIFHNLRSIFKHQSQHELRYTTCCTPTVKC